MNNILKKTVSLALASIISVSSLTATTKNFNINQFEAQAQTLDEIIDNLFEGEYNAYTGYRQAYLGYIRDMCGTSTRVISATVIDESDWGYKNYCTQVNRGDMNIPLYDADCTMICIQNLLNYYRKSKADIGYSETTRGKMYNKLIEIAKNNYGYTKDGGLPLSKHKSMCKAAFEHYRMKNVNVNTFSSLDGFFTQSALLRDEPYILSSSNGYHSVLVYEWRKYKVVYEDSMGIRRTSNIGFLKAYDPSGYSIVVPALNIHKSIGDLEQVMYIKSCEPRT